ncbi:hypothetical protein H8356DRAFT_1424142 [Neocallimastix lanati (nom. inval.)]|nr:hypothetical protein H8356DRAFT_1424142 [Neocallimastix sp. JGI-2020a]
MYHYRSHKPYPFHAMDMVEKITGKKNITKFKDVIESYWFDVAKFQGIKGTNYDYFKFINTRNLFNLSLEYLHLSLGFNWILRLRFVLSSILAMEKVINLLSIGYLNALSFLYVDFINDLFILFANKNTINRYIYIFLLGGISALDELQFDTGEPRHLRIYCFVYCRSLRNILLIQCRSSVALLELLFERNSAVRIPNTEPIVRESLLVNITLSILKMLLLCFIILDLTGDHITTSTLKTHNGYPSPISTSIVITHTSIAHSQHLITLSEQEPFIPFPVGVIINILEFGLVNNQPREPFGYHYGCMIPQDRKPQCLFGSINLYCPDRRILHGNPLTSSQPHFNKCDCNHSVLTLFELGNEGRR